MCFPPVFLLVLAGMLPQKPGLAYATDCVMMGQIGAGNENMKLARKLASIVCVGLLLAAGHAAAQEGGKTIKTDISLGTATPGGGFPLYGNAFAEAMNAADPTISIAPRNTKGSNENIPLLGNWPARYRTGRRRAGL